MVNLPYCNALILITNKSIIKEFTIYRRKLLNIFRTILIKFKIFFLSFDKLLFYSGTMESSGSLLSSLYEWKEDSALKKFLIDKTKQRIMNILTLHTILNILSSYIKEMELYDKTNPYIIVLPDTHDLRRIFKKHIIAVIDLKDYVLNEVKYYGNTGSFASLRETLYVTRANMPIIPVSGEMERIENANSNVARFSNINVRVELNPNFFKVLQDTFGNELHQNIFKFFEVKDYFFRLLCLFGLQTEHTHVSTNGTILRQFTKINHLHMSQYVSLIASLATEINAIDLKSFPRRLKRLLHDSSIELQIKRRHINPEYYLNIRSSNPNTASLSLNLSEYNFQSGWKINPMDSSSDSDDSPIRPTIDVPSSNEYVSETELEIFLSDRELFPNDNNVTMSSDSDEIFLGSINPVRIESESNYADMEQNSPECSIQNFVTKYCIGCTQELTILPLCRNCYHKKIANIPKRKHNKKIRKQLPFKNLKIADISENTDLNVCDICCSKESTHGVMHGNLAHRVGCHNCVKKIKKDYGRCPLCRRKIDKIVKII